jgi:hypothetical protein
MYPARRAADWAICSIRPHSLSAPSSTKMLSSHTVSPLRAHPSSPMP